MSEMKNRLEAQRLSEHSDAQAILDTAKAENRDLTAAESGRFDQHTENLKSIRSRIDTETDRDKTAAAAEESLRNLMGGGRRQNLSSCDAEVDQLFRSHIQSRSLAPFEINQRSDEMRSGFQPGLEQRDLLTSSGSGMTGTTFWNRLQRHFVDSASVLAAGATVVQTETGETLRVPKSTAFSTATIVAEAAPIPESDPTLGSVPFGAWKYGHLVQVSYELAADEKFDLLGFLAEQSGIAVGNAFGAHAVTGTGSGQPRGILTDATLGATGPTGTATSFGSQTTVGQGGDLLLDLAASLAEPYARSRSAAWLMRGATLNAIRKLRDSTGRYVFSTDIIPGSGSAGTLLGRPVYTDPAMPAIGASAKSILFGDISRYWMRQAGGLRFQRSDDFAFANDLATFRVLSRLDGSLVDTTGAVKYFQHSAT